MFHRIRRVAAGTVAAALLLPALTACGGGSSDSAAPSGPTRTVTDVEGTSMQVPVEPKRVVALSEPTLDGALALGVPLVGTITGRGQGTVPNYLAEEAGKLTILGGVANPNYEAIAKAKPDLILVDGTSVNNNANMMKILRSIAPTYNAGYAGGDWVPNFEHVAEALNMTTEGARVVKEYDDAVTATRQSLATTYEGKTFSIVRWQGGSASMILTELPAGLALADLGLARPANQDRRGRGHSEPVSLENIDQIDADYMFFGTLGGSSEGNPTAGGLSDISGATKALKEALTVPGFTALKAVKADHVMPVDGSRWTSTGGPLLMRGLVEDVREALS